MASSTLRISSISHGVPLPRHSLCGASVMNMSVSLRPAGSMPSSSAPARAMMRWISGIAVISSRSIRRSVCAASSTEMVGILADRDHRRAFVHHRHEGLADAEIGEARRRRAPTSDDRRDDERPLHRALEQRIVDACAFCEPATAPALVAGSQQIAGQRRNDRQRQQQRRAERERDRQRDRAEQPALQALQRHQRHEHGDDDDDAGDQRHRDLARRLRASCACAS